MLAEDSRKEWVCTIDVLQLPSEFMTKDLCGYFLSEKDFEKLISTVKTWKG